MRMMNKDLPYEQQMKPILEKYDKLVEENKALKDRVTELEKSLKSAREDARKELDTETKQLMSGYKNRGEKLEWIQKALEDYLVSLGIELPEYRTVTKVVKMIVSI